MSRLEARLLELQIQSQRNLAQIERTIVDADARVGSSAESLGKLIEQILGDREALGGQIAAMEQRVAQVFESQRDSFDRMDRTIREAAGAVQINLQQVPATVSARVEAIVRSVAETAEIAAAEQSKVQIHAADRFHDEFDAAVRRIELTASDARSEGRGDLLAIRANVQDYKDELGRHLSRYETLQSDALSEVRISLSELLAILRDADGETAQLERALEPLSTTIATFETLISNLQFDEQHRYTDLVKRLDHAAMDKAELLETLLEALEQNLKTPSAADDLMVEIRAEENSRYLELGQRLDRIAASDSELLSMVNQSLAPLAEAALDTRERFLAVEEAAKARHKNIVSLMPTIGQLGSALEAHRSETLSRLGEFDDLRGSITTLERLVREEAERQRDLDVIWGGGSPPSDWPRPFVLRTDHPVALESDDHRFPRGTANDNTRSPRFVAACERLYESPLTHLDLGCAGGGLVRDFLIRGHRSFGLEGSDWSLKEQRAEWRALGGRLRTCDITQPFDILDDVGTTIGFDVISAWEVLEHLPEQTLPMLFDNVRRHLARGGIFVASVALFEDRDDATGAVWHLTLKPPEWWAERMASAGLEVVASPFYARDYVRGSGSSCDDWDVVTQPDMGFHVVARAMA